MHISISASQVISTKSICTVILKTINQRFQFFTDFFYIHMIVYYIISIQL